MRVELVYFEGCPNWRRTDESLRQALGALGQGDLAVSHLRVSTLEEAEAAPMHGSPTVLVDGRDAFPQAQAPAGLACRLYPTEQGPSGSPTVQQLKDALSRSLPPRLS